MRTEIEPSQIEELFSSFRKGGGIINGVSLVAEGERILISSSFGVADAKANENNSIKTQFLIGSITKQFTAAALLKSFYDQEKSLIPDLSEKELLQIVVDKIKAPLSSYIKEDDPVWRGEAPTWLNHVSLHHLLCHASGIPNYTADPVFNEFSKVDHTSIFDVVQLFKEKDLEFTPGTKWNYSNSGYILLGIVVEKVTGLKIKEYFQENFFKPLGMTSTFIPSHGRVSDFKKERPSLARGYAWDLFDAAIPMAEQPIYENMLHAHAAGAIISTAEDLHRWNLALYEKKEVLPALLLNLLLGKHMLVDPSNPNIFYAYGLSTQYQSDLYFIGHNGAIPGYFSVLHYYPQSRITLVILQNISGNWEQESELRKELQEKFGHLENNEERWNLQHAYLEKKYPAMFAGRLHYKKVFFDPFTRVAALQAAIITYSYPGICPGLLQFQAFDLL